MRERELMGSEIKEGIELEVQWASTHDLSGRVEDWLMKQGGRLHKEKKHEVVGYYDTGRFRVLRHGMTLRRKDKGDGKFRDDLKIPFDVASGVSRPDEQGVLRRRELEYKNTDSAPSLKSFSDAAALRPVRGDLGNFFKKPVQRIFDGDFDKRKIVISVRADDGLNREDGVVEFNIQRGRMRTADGNRETQLLHVLELEGPDAVLMVANMALKRAFSGKGLAPLEKRKAILGYDLLVDDMGSDLRETYEQARALHVRELALA